MNKEADNILKIDDAAAKWEWLAISVFFICCCVAWIAHSVLKAEANANCWERGGLMQPAHGEMQCVMREKN